jgi:hypothetical protein
MILKKTVNNGASSQMVVNLSLNFVVILAYQLQTPFVKKDSLETFFSLTITTWLKILILAAHVAHAQKVG